MLSVYSTPVKIHFQMLITLLIIWKSIDSGEGRIGTDESTFNSMLVTRSWPYLRQIMAEYQSISGHSLETAVAKEFSFNAEKGLLAIRKWHFIHFKFKHIICYFSWLKNSEMCSESTCLLCQSFTQCDYWIRNQRVSE